MSIPEPEQARPWHPHRDGPWPEVWTWPHGARPALSVWSAGKWRPARVMARQNWANGAVYYQVEVDPLGDSQIYIRTYRWPQPGLRAAYGSNFQPSTAARVERQRNMPRRADVHVRKRAGQPSC
ncbi:hypothetical protein ABCR94_28135 [Streptomyces sp. 21So2-11]|uniref:hypothetical protein n=1 Tax=Streptomyces sp. 21So2-11 TaxID=3144408 RepID=UPI003219779D